MGTEVQGPAPPLTASPHRQVASPPQAPVSSRVDGEKQLPTPLLVPGSPLGKIPIHTLHCICPAPRNPPPTTSQGWHQCLIHPCTPVSTTPSLAR